LRHREQYLSHSDDVAGRYGELEVLVDALQSSKDGLADAATTV